jgi:DnaJ domain
MTDRGARSILGLPPVFTPHDLKRAYRRAAADNHPDRGGSNERMVLVNEAFEMLSGRPAVSAAGASPESSTWTAADAGAFHRETGYTPPAPEDPLERYVRGVAGVVAVVAWIAGMIDTINDFPTLRGWLVLGLPFCYLLALWPVRCVVRVGIHVYNFVTTFRERIGPLGT